MSYTVSKYPAGTFSWADVQSTDINKTKAFLNGLFGWTSKDIPTGEGRPDYTMFYLGDKTVAGGAPTFMKEMPTFWSSYISVDDVDAVTKKAAGLGAKVMMEPMDVLDSGRMASIQDPTDAVVCLWQPKKHIGASIVNAAGAMSWNELYTPDVKKAQEFYSKLFGWSYDTFPEQQDYIRIKNNGRANGGIIQLTPEMEGFPPNWTVYFTVADRDKSLKKVKELGGSLMMSVDVPVGKIAFVSDPTHGAPFAIMQMAMKPDEWKE